MPRPSRSSSPGSPPGSGPEWQVRRRLAAAAELVNVFEGANQTALAPAWLREMDPTGYVPARVLRHSEGDEISVKALLEAADDLDAHARGRVAPVASAQEAATR